MYRDLQNWYWVSVDGTDGDVENFWYPQIKDYGPRSKYQDKYPGFDGTTKWVSTRKIVS